MASQLQIDICTWEDFKEYAEKAKSLPPATKDADKLVLCGLYKQATAENVEQETVSEDTNDLVILFHAGRPGFFSLTKRAKWDAWKAFEKNNKDEMMREYINKVKQVQKQTSTK